MSWNAVLNLFMEIKEAAVKKGIALWDYNPDEETCLEYWVRSLGLSKYTKIIKYLVLNEYKDFLLLRYGNFYDVFSKGSGVTFDSFFDLYDGLYRECRSVVINIKLDELVLTPFRKFRNLNEAEETSYEVVAERIRNASCVEISDKLDGSMQCARCYKGEIVMAGSKSLNMENSWRLADGYRMLFMKAGYERMLRDYEDKTFIFEYISKKDAHVVHYDEEGLFLIGIRDVVTGREASYREVIEMAAKYELPTTRVFDKHFEDILGELDDKTSDQAEGFVLNIDGFKVKIKYNDYVYMHKVFSAMSSINVIIEAVAEDRIDDMIAKVPMAYKRRVLNVVNRVYSYKTETEDLVDLLYEKAPKDDRKTFMVWVEDHVPAKVKGYVRAKYLGQNYNVLKHYNGYLKLKDMYPGSYEDVLAGE